MMQFSNSKFKLPKAKIPKIIRFIGLATIAISLMWIKAMFLILLGFFWAVWVIYRVLFETWEAMR